MKNRRFVTIFFSLSIPLILLCFVFYLLAPRFAPNFNNPALLLLLPVIIIGSYIVARSLERVAATRAGQPEYEASLSVPLSPLMQNLRAIYEILLGAFMGILVTYLGAILAVVIGGYIFGEALRGRENFIISLMRSIFVLGLFAALLVLPIHYVPIGARRGFLNGGSRFLKSVPWLAAACYLLVPTILVAISQFSGLKVEAQWVIPALAVTLFAGALITYFRTKIVLNPKDGSPGKVLS